MPWIVLASAIAMLPAYAQQASPLPDAGRPAGRGIIAGQVLDKTTGRPLPFSNVVLVGTQIGAQSDLDGRFRLTLVPPGLHSVRALRIGFAPSQIDSVKVIDGETTSLTFALGPVAQQLQTVQVEAGPTRATSEDGLLALQKAAPRVSDGISAEAIKRAPGSDASDAILRVTGVSVLNKKFPVVRGLAERYSNTLLNGVDLPSPEPLKKIVPLDLFPSSLLESIVVNKTATPDRPGDFAGGSVEITTKEFPDERVGELSLSVGYGSQSTFRKVSQLPQHGLDFLGFDSGNRRQMPANAPLPGPPGSDSERFAEDLRNIWTPAPSTILPDLGMGINLGGRFGSESNPFGYAAALTYSRKTDFTPNRLSQLLFDQTTGIADKGYVAYESSTSVDLGVILNLAAMAGQASKFGWKNLYTRTAEELLARSTGFETYNGPAERLIYQARYITRDLLQTQLTGDHLIEALFNSRIEWKATLAASARDEPENRSLIYFKQLSDGQFVQAPPNPSPYWFRFLDDQVRGAQLDWSIPVDRALPVGSLVKFGGGSRARDRAFDASYYEIVVRQGMALAEPTGFLPEQALAPENIGTVFVLDNRGTYALPYEADDDLTSAYAMLDLPLPANVRVIGGMRMEDWRLNVFQGSRENPINEPTRRHNGDYLWSGNLTWGVTDRQNVRLAAYRTVARPDPREVAPDYYVAITGDCANQGNPEVERTRILNGDVRWEMYPAAGELFSISGFYKHFDRPIAELLTYPGSSACTTEYINVDQARLLGAELELRKALAFLPGAWSRLAVGINVTLVDSRADFRPTDDLLLNLRLQGQSNYIANLNLLYTDADRGIEGSVLVNGFGDRIVRYGIASLTQAGELIQVPHVMEQGRVTVDAKLQKKLGRGLSASISGRNLTDAEVNFYQGSNVGRVRTGYQRPGMSLNLGVGYAHR